MISLSDHSRCAIVSILFRGRLCQQLATRPARRFERDEVIYQVGDPASSIYFVRKGLVRTSVLSESGGELVLDLYLGSKSCPVDNEAAAPPRQTRAVL
jgi:CRP-like cAMP-binding protein